jgi:hypothetical protein
MMHRNAGGFAPWLLPPFVTMVAALGTRVYINVLYIGGAWIGSSARDEL